MAETISLTTQTMYAELVDRCAAAAFETEFPLNGSFVRVTVKGRGYWYFQEGARDASGRQHRKYVGPDTPETLARIEHHGKAKHDYRERRHLIAMLRRYGFRGPSEDIGRVVQTLSAAGIFRMRACLIGTAAYQVYGPMLGVRLPIATLRTQDLDIAQFTAVSLAIAKDETTAPLLDVLRIADSSFRAIPHTRKAEATTVYMNDRGFRVEVLTENRGPERETPTSLPAIGTDAQPLRFLDFLIYEEIPAALLHDAGVLVNVPSPARYAVHKLIVAQRRRKDSAKVEKDLKQAEALLDALALRRPSDLIDAWQEATRRGPKWRQLLTRSLSMIEPEVRDRALHTFGATRNILPNHALRFADPRPHYDFGRDIVLFPGQANSHRVLCAISREALEDHFGADGVTAEGRLAIFRKNRREIEQMARVIYLNRPVPADGAVLIKTADVPYLRRIAKQGKVASKQ
jgi:hypothetical protein